MLLISIALFGWFWVLYFAWSQHSTILSDILAIRRQAHAKWLIQFNHPFRFLYKFILFSTFLTMWVTIKWHDMISLAVCLPAASHAMVHPRSSRNLASHATHGSLSTCAAWPHLMAWLRVTWKVSIRFLKLHSAAGTDSRGDKVKWCAAHGDRNFKFFFFCCL